MPTKEALFYLACPWKMLEVVKPEQGGLWALVCNCHNKDIQKARVKMKKKKEAEVIEQILF